MKKDETYPDATDISGMAKKQFNFRFEEKLIADIQKLANKDNRTLTNYIENILTLKVQEEKKKATNNGK